MVRADEAVKRILGSPEVSEEAKRELGRIYLSLNPPQLKRDIASCQDRLLELAANKPQPRKEVGPPPGHPWTNVVFGQAASRTFFMSQGMARSRTLT